MTEFQVAKPGWYPDPLGSGINRYWDGDEWMPLHQLSEAERTIALDAVVAEMVRYGWRVESRSATQVVVTHGAKVSDSAHALHLLITIFTCGLWAFIWIPIAMFSSEKRMTLTVDIYGNVH